MKKILLMACLILAGGAVQAQITPENVYQGTGYMVRMGNGDYKYQMSRYSNAQVTLYNLNHSVYKQFTVPSLGAAYNRNSAYYVSNTLFDTNANTVEYVVSYSVAGGGGGVSKTIIYSETGAQLALIDSTDYVDIYNTPAGTKMLASKTIYNSTTGSYLTDYTRVYGLAGQLALSAVKPNLSSAATAYPNPAQAVVNLPYSVPAGQAGALTVYNVSGRLVSTYKVDDHINHLEMSTRDLNPGVYLYRVETSAGVTPSQRFTVE